MEVTQSDKQKGINIALITSDQRMPGIDGTEFLEEVIKLYPHSTNILIAAYGRD